MLKNERTVRPQRHFWFITSENAKISMHCNVLCNLFHSMILHKIHLPNAPKYRFEIRKTVKMKKNHQYLVIDSQSHRAV
jgi:hypothetical protein